MNTQSISRWLKFILFVLSMTFIIVALLLMIASYSKTVVHKDQKKYDSQHNLIDHKEEDSMNYQIN